MPFTIEQFIEVFRSYNTAIFPAQLVLLSLSVIALVLVGRGGKDASKVVYSILAILWLWTGVVYHLIFFTRINNAAYGFAALCVVQALIFLIIGVVRGRLAFRPQLDLRGSIGGAFILYALAVYPILGYLLGHVYPASPTFGAPCPTTIFTFGILLLSAQRLPVYVYAIPFVWSLIGSTAVFQFGVREDLGLLAAGVVSTFFLFTNKTD